MGRAWTDKANRPTDAVASNSQHRSSEINSSDVPMPGTLRDLRGPPLGTQALCARAEGHLHRGITAVLVASGGQCAAVPRAPCANIRRPGARTREAAVPVVGLFESLKVGALREATTSSFPRACRLPGKLQVSE